MTKAKSTKPKWKPALIKKNKLTFVVYAKLLSDKEKNELECDFSKDWYFIKYLYVLGELEIYIEEADYPVSGDALTILGDK